jgi:hypothetical protein
MFSSSSDLIAQRADALAVLVESRLPVDVNAPGAAQAWPLVGPGLLAHATHTLRSIIMLERATAYNDAFRLLRSLYDHVLTLAWLAGDPAPPARLEEWRLEDLENRLKADREASAAGEPLLEASIRTQWEAELAAASSRAPDLASKAFAADRYWQPQLPELTSVKLGSFRGQYTILFRNYSGLVHATFRGLNWVTEDLPDGKKRVVLQSPLHGYRPDGVATALHGLGLYVAAHSLGWPNADEVTAVFDRYPGP